MRTLKMNIETEITFNEAKELVKNTFGEYDFNNLNQSTITDTVPFEVIQNRKYYITKIGRKGSKLYPGSEYEETAEIGIFEIKMTYDYKHPSNFALNGYNCTWSCKIAK